MSETQHELLNTYKRASITFVRGQGAKLFDHRNREYLDMLAGLAVVSVGHAQPRVVQAICQQAGQLAHVSNLFWTEPMMQLSRRLAQVSGGDFKSFFCNSGAESIECALKFARKATGRKNFVCATKSFHGRTFATLAATGQPEKWKGFEPLPDWFSHAEFNNLSAFEKLITAETAAVLIEPVQGEGGVFPSEPEFLNGLRKLCSERGALLMFDEVQSGCGRTGSWWAWQQYGVRPDVFVTAKGLANGLPIGACLVHESLADHFEPGNHGSTFGGGPIQTAAALATLEVLESDGLIQEAQEKGALLAELLQQIPGVKAVRGLGLMRAAQLEFVGSQQVAERLLELGVIVNSVTKDALRITPPLCISRQEIEFGVSQIARAIADELDARQAA